jgi:hypothetical protein
LAGIIEQRPRTVNKESCAVVADNKTRFQLSFVWAGNRNDAPLPELTPPPACLPLTTNLFLVSVMKGKCECSKCFRKSKRKFWTKNKSAATLELRVAADLFSEWKSLRG